MERKSGQEVRMIMDLCVLYGRMGSGLCVDETHFQMAHGKKTCATEKGAC